MHKAGRHLCSQAPKEDRKIFSTTEHGDAQVGVEFEIHVFQLHSLVIHINNMYIRFSVSMISLAKPTFIYRVVKSTSSNREKRFVTFSRKALLIKTTNCSFPSNSLSIKSDMLFTRNILYLGNTLSTIEFVNFAGSWDFKDLLLPKVCTYTRIQE